AQASIRYRNTGLEVGRPFGERLAAFFQIAFQHQSDERMGAGGALLDDTAPTLFLAGVFRARVGMAAIHHHDRRQARASQFAFSLPNALGFIARAQAAASKDE